MISQAHATLAATVWHTNKVVLKNILLAVLGTIALWISAKVSIPFWPVPLTMQTLVVLMIGMTFGWRLGGATLLLYLAEGAVGLPVFAGTPEKGIGVAYMMGSTGGYLVGFVLAAITVGWLAERGWDRNPLTTAAAMLLGNIIIYVPGLVWLGSVVGWEKPIFAWGLTPFLAGDALKLALAAALMPLGWHLASNRSADRK